MKSKARRRNETSDNEQYSLLHIPNLLVQCSNENILNNVKHFNDAKTIEDQIQLIHQFSNQLNCSASEENTTYILNILIHLFVNASSKHAIKKSIIRVLMNSRKYHSIMSNILANHLQTLFQNNVADINFSLLNSYVCVINDCFNNFPAGIEAISIILEDVFEFLIRVFKHFIDKLGDVTSPNIQEHYTYIHNASRALIAVSQQCDITKIIPNYAHDITVYCIKIFNITDISFDTRNNCSIFLLTAINTISDTGYISVLNLCFNKMKSNSNKSNSKSDLAFICMFAGVLNTVELDKLSEPNILKITESLLTISKCSADKPCVVLASARTLLLISRSLKSILDKPIYQKVFNLLFNYLQTLLDHRVDTVRHVAKQILINLVKLVQPENKGPQNLYFSVIRNVLKMDDLKPSKYVALGILANHFGCGVLLKEKFDLVPSLISTILSCEPSTKTYIFNCYENLMKCDNEWQKRWIQPIMEELHLIKNTNDLNGFQNVLINAVKLRPEIFYTIVEKNQYMWGFGWYENNIHTILKCAIVIKKMGMPLTGDYLNRLIRKAAYDQNDEIRLANLTIVAESQKSVEIFSSIDLNFTLKFLKYNLDVQEASIPQKIVFLYKKILTRFSDGYYAIIRDYKKLITLENNSIDAKETRIDTLKDQKILYETYIFDLWKHTFEHLFPGACLSRRLICLEILTFAQPIIDDVLPNLDKSSPAPVYWKQCYVNILKYFVHDSYEIIKQLATKILSKCLPELLELDTVTNTQVAINQGLKYASSIKPAETQTAAYLFELCLHSPVLKETLHSTSDDMASEYLLLKLLMENLKQEIEQATSSLLVAAGSAPMHGTLFCIRHLLQKLFSKNLTGSDWQLVVSDLIVMCMKANELVAPVVNNSSPEGHLPMDTDQTIQLEINDDSGDGNNDGDDDNNDDDDDDDDNSNDNNDEQQITAQMLLVCAWRTVKEVSLLLGDLVLNASIISESKDQRTGLLTDSVILEIGDHFIRLLTETKHRGAFEQAYVGFTKICTRLWQCKTVMLHRLPVSWLSDILNVIECVGDTSKPNNKKLCATRRSAGVPFMIQAILVSELETGSTGHFHRCIQTLLRYANDSDDTNREHRIHAMNILRALYRNTQLGEEILQYTADGITVSIVGFSRKTWAERNSATLLFSSLMVRIFGVLRNRDTDQVSVRNRMTARVFFLHSPSLHSFLLKQLKELTDDECEEHRIASLYPILLLLARLYPSSDEENPDNLLNDFVPYVRACAKINNLKIRELAAKALTSLLTQEQRVNLLKELFNNLKKTIENTNYLHGLMLQIYYLITEIEDFEKTFDISGIIKKTWWLLDYNSCIIISILYMQIVSKMLPKSQPTYMTQLEKLFNKEDAKRKVLIYEELFKKLTEHETFVKQHNVVVGKCLYMKESTCLRLNLLRFYYNDDGLKICKFLFKMLLDSNENIVECVLNFFLYYLNALNEPNEDTLFWLDNLCEQTALQEKALALCYYSDMKSKLYTSIIRNQKYNETVSKVFTHIYTNYEKLTTKAFILISYFREAFLKPTFSKYFSWLIVSVVDSDDERACAIINCIRQMWVRDIFSREFMEFFRASASFEYILEAIYECSLPHHSPNCRFIIALLYRQLSIIENVQRIQDLNPHMCCAVTMWKTILQLSTDPEPIVRYTIAGLFSDFGMVYVIGKTRSKLIEKCLTFFTNVSRETGLRLLLFWAVTNFEKTSPDAEIDGQVFDRGEISTFMDDMSLNKMAAREIKQFITVYVDSNEFKTRLAYILNIFKYETNTDIINVEKLVTFLNKLYKRLDKPDPDDTVHVIKTLLNEYAFDPIIQYKLKNIVVNLLPNSIEWTED